MSWQSVLKAPRPSKNMTEGVKKIYVLLTTDDKKKLTALLEKYMKENGDNHFKRTANQLRSKLRYVAFPSFFRDPPISIDNIHEGKDMFRPKGKDGKQPSVKQLREDPYYKSPQMVHTEKYIDRLDMLLDIYEKNFYRTKPMLTKLVKQGDFDDVLRYMKGEVDFDAVEYIKNENLILKPRGKNKKLTKDEKEQRNRDISKLFKDRDIQKTLTNKYKDNPETLGYSLSDDLIVVMPLSAGVTEETFDTEVKAILNGFTKKPVLLPVEYRGNNQTETEDEPEDVPEDEKGSIDAQKEKDADKPKQKTKSREGFYLYDKKISIKTSSPEVIGLTKFAPFLSIEEIDSLAGSKIHKGKIERTQLAKILGKKDFNSLKMKPKTTTDKSAKIIRDKKDDNIDISDIDDKLAKIYFENVMNNVRKADRPKFLFGTKKDFFENVKVSAFQSALAIYFRYDSDNVGGRLDDMIITNKVTVSEGTLLHKLKMLLIIESDGQRQSDFNEAKNSFSETTSTQWEQLLSNFKSVCKIVVKQGQRSVTGWRTWLTRLSEIRTSDNATDEEVDLLNAYENVLKDMEDMPTISLNVKYTLLTSDTRTKLLDIVENIDDYKKSEFNSTIQNISTRLSLREMKRFLEEREDFQDMLETMIPSKTVDFVPETTEGAVGNFYISGTDGSMDDSKTNSIAIFKDRYMNEEKTQDNQNDEPITLDSLPKEEQYKLNKEYQRLLKFSRNIDELIDPPNVELRTMYDEIDSNKNREIDESETDRADVKKIKEVLLKRFDSIKRKILDEIKVSMVTVSKEKTISKPKTTKGKTQGFKPLEWLNSKGL